MTTEELRCFITLADVLNYRKAAQQLYISQPALSRRISDLEHDCGFELFERSTRCVTLTEKGKSCLEQARKCLRELELLDKKIEEIRNPSVRRFSIGFTTVGHTRLLGPTIGIITQRHDDIQITPVHQQAKILLESIREKTVDLGLHCIYSMKTGQKEFKIIPLGYPGFSAKVPIRHPLAHRKILSVRDLHNETLLMFQRNHDKETYDAIMNRFSEYGAAPRFIQADGHAEVEVYMENGQAISLASAYPYPTDNSRIIPIKELGEEFAVCAICRKDNADPLISEFIDLLIRRENNTICELIDSY